MPKSGGGTGQAPCPPEPPGSSRGASVTRCQSPASPVRCSRVPSWGVAPARHGMAQHGIAWHSAAWHSTAWHGMMRCSTAQHAATWHGAAWHSMAQRGACCPLWGGCAWWGGSGRTVTPPLLVPGQQRHAGEGPGAGTAPVLLDVRVGLEVGAEVGSVGESPAAVGAGVGLLPCGTRVRAPPYPRSPRPPHPLLHCSHHLSLCLPQVLPRNPPNPSVPP